MLLELMWTLVLSVVIYQETMPFNKMLGCGFLLASLLLYRVSLLRLR